MWALRVSVPCCCGASTHRDMGARGGSRAAVLGAAILVVCLASSLEAAHLDLYDTFGCSMIASLESNFTSDTAFSLITETIAASLSLDNVAQSFAMSGIESASFAPDGEPYLTGSEGVVGASGWQLLNDQCRFANQSWPFNMALLDTAEYLGQEMCDVQINDQPLEGVCDRYALDFGVAGMEMLFYVVEQVDRDGVETDLVLPVEMAITSTVTVDKYGVESMQHYNFSSFILSLPDGAFDAPELCQEPPAICPLGPVEEMDMFRFHGPKDFDVEQHNTADLKGDVSYLCMQLPGVHDTQLSKFRVEVNTTWGQYSMCNDGVCEGGSTGTVGHEGANHFGSPMAGQCEDNSFGNWFSLTREAHCAEGAEVGADGCAWRGPLVWYKTVEHQCLLDNGLLEACFHDGKMPFPNAVKVVENAFASEDPALGGCRNVYSAPGSPGATSGSESSVDELSSGDDTDNGLNSDIDIVDENERDMMVFIAIIVCTGLFVMAVIAVIVVVGVKKYRMSSSENFMQLSDMANELALDDD